jgi:mandelate racemase
MAVTDLIIEDVKVRAVVAPLRRPIRTAVGTIPSAPLVLIDVLTKQGNAGRSYVFAYTAAALRPLTRLVTEIGAELKGKAIAPALRMQEFDRRFRLVGWQGLIGMAVAGLDMAFWDAIARTLDQPLVALLGGQPIALAAYDSYGMIDPKVDEKVLSASVESGFQAIKIKLGEGDLEQDIKTLRAVRSIIGPSITLMVDYNQSLDPAEASRRIARIAEFDLCWVEEPVRAEDLAGHARVRSSAAIPIQTGENWWFPRDMAKAIGRRL